MPVTNNIINSIASADLHVIELVDPDRIRFFAHNLANQINAYRMSYPPQKTCTDLSQWVTDIIIETTVQGASLLEVHIIDPFWTLLRRDPDGVSFIDVDDQGFLW